MSKMTAIVSPWVADEMSTVDLKERWLNKGLGEVLSQLGGQPTASIPAACGGHAEMTAAYRVFHNAKATVERILKAHGEATRRRVAEEPVALLVQDATEVDVTRPPWRADRALPAVAVNVVLVREATPPSDDEAVEWQLLTSLPIEASDQVRQVIQYACVRWMIEVFFRVLKSGCRVEQRRFEHLDRLVPGVAVYLIVAWRTLFVCRLGRRGPAMRCDAVFEPAEWKAVWQVVHRTAPPPTPPSLDEMVRLVAQLGGCVNRRGAGPPGPQPVWTGLQRTYDFAIGWCLFGPETQTDRTMCSTARGNRQSPLWGLMRWNPACSPPPSPTEGRGGFIPTLTLSPSPQAMAADRRGRVRRRLGTGG